MEAVQIKMALKNAKFLLRIMWIGFCRTVFGTAVTALIAAAIFGFVSVSKETGWAAVCNFITACVLLAGGLINMYFMGRNKKSGSGKRERRLRNGIHF